MTDANISREWRLCQRPFEIYQFADIATDRDSAVPFQNG
jgi:hypothetical protein